MQAGKNSFLLTLLLVLWANGFGLEASRVKDTNDSPQLVLQFGDNIPSVIAERTQFYIKKASQYPVSVIPSQQNLPNLPAGSFVLSFGNGNCTWEIISEQELEKLGSEGFIVRSKSIGQVTLYAANGNLPSPDTFNLKVSTGATYATYTLLQKVLGFAFLHPLEPLIPTSLAFPSNSMDLQEQPYWPIRGWHIHSMHPLELTELLNGLAMNLSTNQQEWEKMLPEFANVLEWLVANRQNRLEWVLLLAEEWAAFGNSSLRQSRFSVLTTMCHSFGIAAGADVPIAEQQQHAWYMVEDKGTLEQQFQRIHNRVDWLLAAGFDFISTENGYSEFTHPDDRRMLAWMNELANYTTNQYQYKKVYIKIHCSTGQTCKNFKDPWTGKPLNFNFLPIYAIPEMGIYPHTVQFYSFDDPTAGSYGNKNFSYMFDFMFNETLRSPNREVIFHGETAYWVNYDIDVPLFLPIYGLSRLRDMRMIANQQIKVNKTIHGQMNFDSGWEWGYWFNDVITARAAWDPVLSETDDMKALYGMMDYTICAYFGKASTQACELLMQLIQAEKDLLIYGIVNGTAPSDVVKRTGISYIEGWDTWSDISCGLTSMGCTQPVKLGLEELRFNPFVKPHYTTQVRPLLSAMATTFTRLADQMDALTPSVDGVARKLWVEMVDGTRMNALRSVEVFALYEYVHGWLIEPAAWRKAQLQKALDSLQNASLVMKKREALYRVPLERIAGWRNNPTSYPYAYLWTAHSMYYFWRDMGKAMGGSLLSLSPCYMNIINPIDVAFGEGVFLNFTKIAREYLDKIGMGQFIADCLAAPSSEPHYSYPPFLLLEEQIKQEEDIYQILLEEQIKQENLINKNKRRKNIPF